MPRITAVAGGQRAPLDLKRSRFKDVWAQYPIGMAAADVYQKVGGNVYELYRENPDGYANACALRLSLAFNYGGLTITSKASAYRAKGADGKAYFLRVKDMVTFVKANFGQPDQAVAPAGKDKTADFAGKKAVLIFTVSGCGDHCYFVHEQPGISTTLVQFWELQ